MGFAEQIRAFVAKTKSREAAVYANSVEHAFHSIRYGSDVTGAPGQPVASGELLESWELDATGRREAVMKSDAPHADVIEENRRGATLRSAVGGFHSVKLTRLGWRRIVAHELKKLGNGRGHSDGVPHAEPAVVNNAQPRDARGRFGRVKRARIHVRG